MNYFHDPAIKQTCEYYMDKIKPTIWGVWRCAINSAFYRNSCHSGVEMENVPVYKRWCVCVGDLCARGLTTC